MSLRILKKMVDKAIHAFAYLHGAKCEFCSKRLDVEDYNLRGIKMLCSDQEDEFHKDCQELKEHYFKDLAEAKERLVQETEELGQIYEKGLEQIREEYKNKCG